MAPLMALPESLLLPPEPADSLYVSECLLEHELVSPGPSLLSSWLWPVSLLLERSEPAPAPVREVPGLKLCTLSIMLVDA